MSMHKREIAAAAAGIAVTAILAGCGTSTNHDTLNPSVDIQLQWWRVETPPSVVTEFFACFGTTGLLLDQADGNIANTPDDPMCPKGGTPYTLVQRHASDPAVIVGSYRLVPPDSTGKWTGVDGKA
jgi:hypothetical protein